MTCPLSPFAAAQGEPTAPQDGQSHPDGKGMHSNVLWVQPLCLVIPLHFIGRPLIPHSRIRKGGVNLG